MHLANVYKCQILVEGISYVTNNSNEDIDVNIDIGIDIVEGDVDTYIGMVQMPTLM